MTGSGLQTVYISCCLYVIGSIFSLCTENSSRHNHFKANHCHRFTWAGEVTRDLSSGTLDGLQFTGSNALEYFPGGSTATFSLNAQVRPRPCFASRSCQCLIHAGAGLRPWSVYQHVSRRQRCGNRDLRARGESVMKHVSMCLLACYAIKRKVFELSVWVSFATQVSPAHVH